ncbi:SCO family protein [bacterium]|nr:SCO family protein [bacterium]
MFETLVERFRRNPYFWAAVISMITITILTPLTRRVPMAPAVIGTVPSFSMMSEQGKPFGSKQLSGHTYVASFIFTRCKSFCPMITQHLRKLQERVVAEKLPLTIVSFTVDPEFDSAAVLKAHAATLSAQPDIWTFVTGAHTAMSELLEKGFMVGMGAPTITGGMMDIAHAQKLVLVDGKARIRGFYYASPEGIEEIFARAEAVIGESLL